jgi:hypothetical protein
MSDQTFLAAAILTAATWSSPVFASTLYDITFTGETPLPTTASFLYDSTTGFSQFFLTWDGVAFDLTTAANNFSADQTDACLENQTGVQAAFAVLTNCPSPFWYGLNGDDFASFQLSPSETDSFSLGINRISDSVTTDTVVGNDQSIGSFSTTAAVPEPSPMFLTSMSLLALALVGGKRNVLGLSRANRMKS